MGAIDHLQKEFGRLPGIGPKTATRLVYHLLKGGVDDLRRLASALREVSNRVRQCRTCGNFSEEEECEICLNPRRDRGLLCVVEEAHEVAAIERTGAYRGLFHVLGGRLSPLDGIGPEELSIPGLLERVQKAEPEVAEVILATNTNLEGEATAVVNRAKGDADRFKRVLKAYRTAPDVTRTRLYLETMEKVYGNFSQMTIVDKGVEGLLPIFQPSQSGATR